MCFHATKKKRVAIAGQRLHGAAELIVRKATELELVDGKAEREQGSDFRNSGAESAGVLSGNQSWKFKDVRHANEQLSVANQCILIKDRRQEFFLDVDDE